MPFRRSVCFSYCQACSVCFIATACQPGNVFTGVCHSAWAEGVLTWPLPMMHGDLPPSPWYQTWALPLHLTLDTRYGTYPLDTRHRSLPPYNWHLVAITGDLSKLVHCRAYSPSLILTSSGSHRKQTVCILLECCLVECCDCLETL